MSVTPQYFIENLTLSTWFGTVWPRLRKDLRSDPARPPKIRFIDADPGALGVARRMAGRSGCLPERFEFDAENIYDETGMQVWLRIYYRDMADALRYVLEESAFNHSSLRTNPHLACFLRKECLPGMPIAQRSGLWRATYLLHVCLWRMRSDGLDARDAVLFFERRPWMAAFERYAAAAGGAAMVPSGTAFDFPAYLRRLLGRDGRVSLERLGVIAKGQSQRRRRPETTGRAPLIALQYYGQFNLDSPERHSDFFYYQQSSLPGRSLVALFGIPQDPLDAGRIDAMKRHGVSALALRYSAATDPSFVDEQTSLARRATGAARLALRAHRPGDSLWMQAETFRFQEDRNYWRSLFERRHIKIMTTWFKYNAEHCVMARALRDVGGALAVYQRSYEGNATAQATLCTDVYFGFSHDSARIEREAGSNIDYCVVTGYLGDHRFPLVREAAQEIRTRLQRNGAEFIAAYFDEGAFADARWGLTYGRLREHYGFLLEKVVSESAFGLVLKPKTPHTLRGRLGPLGVLLDRAQATGRCHIYADGVLQGAVPPAQAALSADLAIHCSVSAGTAAVEAALAGVPTVMVDEDGWTISPLYRMDKGRVIFNDLASLWYTWHDHRRFKNGVPGFADWSSLIDTLDPYRDGRAAQRMGNYLKWMIEGFEAGLPRETVLADAAGQYCDAWGSDKVTSVGLST